MSLEASDDLSILILRFVSKKAILAFVGRFFNPSKVGDLSEAIV